MTDVKGYTPLSEQQKVLANEGKELEERVLRWLEKVGDSHGMVPFGALGSGTDTPLDFLVIGKRNIQQGFMWSIRSIFQPHRIRLPEDD